MREVGVLCAVIAGITAIGCGTAMDDLSTEGPEAPAGSNSEPGGGATTSSEDQKLPEPTLSGSNTSNGGGTSPSCSTVVLAPTAAASIGTGIDWLNPDAARLDDELRAETRVQGVDVSRDLVVSSFNAAIPTGATIKGVVLDIDRSGGSCVLTKKLALLVGNIERSVPNVLDTPWNGISRFGSESDAWGGLAPAQVNDAAFGVVMKVAMSTAVGCTNTRSGRVDAVRLQVTFCTGGSI